MVVDGYPRRPLADKDMGDGRDDELDLEALVIVEEVLVDMMDVERRIENDSFYRRGYYESLCCNQVRTCMRYAG